MKVIIVDDSREYMTLVRRMLASALPEIEVTEYDPEQDGKPGPDFDWSLYDVLLLDYQIGPSETGLDWLREFGSAPGFPPAVLMTAVGDEYVAASAIKLGAHDFIKKSDVTSATLQRVVLEAGKTRKLRAALLHDTIKEKLRQDTRVFQQVDKHGRNPDGSRIGYRFVRLIGQGASSRIYLAERLHDKMTLVLKIIDVFDIHDTQLLKRFTQEAEMIADIDSPYVVRFLEHGFTRNYGYIAMEFFSRGDLKQRLEPGISEADATTYFLHICYGLRAIHNIGIVHRDLKPGNIMFRADDSLALSDFGISKRLDATRELTKVGSVLGTPNYLSPEQALGCNLDHRTDFYSAGVILYEMLTGAKPYRADTPAGLVYQHVHAAVPRLPHRFAHHQPMLDRLLAKLPADRYDSADAIITDITRRSERLQPAIA